MSNRETLLQNNILCSCK